MRPYPEAAENVTIRQVGARIRVEWTAPTRNTDETVEKLELAEVEVRRRVIDIPALIEAQTEVIEPEELDEPDEPEVSREVLPENLDAPTLPASIPTELPTELELPPGVEVPDELLSEAESLLEEAVAESEGPTLPTLQIPNFAPESRYVTTFASTVPGEPTEFEEDIDPTWIGKRMEYAVVYINRGNRRGRRSTVVQIEPVVALETPGPPDAEPGDGHVDVWWPAPDPPPESEEPSFYSVFRRAGNAEDYPDRPLNPLPVDVTEFRDHGAPFDVRACYIVRTVTAPPVPEPDADTELALDADPETPEDETPDDDVALDEPAPDAAVPVPEGPIVVIPVVPPLKNVVRIESEASPEVCLTAVDTFALPAPTGLVAVASNEDVLLTWREVDRPDAAGYRVYRSESESGPFTAIHDELVRVASFSDETVSRGVTYFYAVTVLDDAKVPNESERSALSEVRFRPQQ